MYNSLMKRKSELKNKKGFTLVEVIVVLVILAILAAILIPSFIGYIDRANEKSAIVEARSVLLAAQTVASEAYAEDSAVTAITKADVASLADVTAANITSPTGDNMTVANGKVADFEYTSNGKTVKYTASTQKLEIK